MAQVTQAGNKVLLGARQKFLRVHVNSPHVHSLVEVLKSPKVFSRPKEIKFAREGIMLDSFFKVLASDEQRAWYGQIMSPLRLTGVLLAHYTFPTSSSDRVILMSESDMFNSWRTWERNVVRCPK